MGFMLGDPRPGPGPGAAGPADPIRDRRNRAGYLRAMDIRRCARPACSEPSAAHMAYDYANRVVWLDAPAGTDGGATWGLCASHAGALRVPRGWAIEDRRRPPAAPIAV
jgi:hypothetical protein